MLGDAHLRANGQAPVWGPHILDAGDAADQSCWRRRDDHRRRALGREVILRSHFTRPTKGKRTLYIISINVRQGTSARRATENYSRRKEFLGIFIGKLKKNILCRSVDLQLTLLLFVYSKKMNLRLKAQQCAKHVLDVSVSGNC